MLKDYHVREGDGDQGSYFSEEHQEDELEIPSWRGVLTRLQSAGLTVKLKKSKFAYTSCEYLGHIVGNQVIKPVLDKVEAVRAFPRPETKMAVRTFLGLTGYCRRFMPNFASVAAPFTDLTKKSMPNSVVWNDKCEDAFKVLKDMLCSDPVLNSQRIHSANRCIGSRSGGSINSSGRRRSGTSGGVF